MRSWKPLAGAVVAMTISTAAVIAIIYVEWRSLDVSIQYATRYFSKWRWLSGSAAISIITALLPFYFHWRSNGDHQRVVSDITAYCLLFLWGPLLVFYPGTSALELHSDPSCGIALALMVLVQLAGGRYVCSTL